MRESAPMAEVSTHYAPSPKSPSPPGKGGRIVTKTLCSLGQKFSWTGCAPASAIFHRMLEALPTYTIAHMGMICQEGIAPHYKNLDLGHGLPVLSVD